MKILHTSDWHLGHRLHEQSQSYEQNKFLEWLIQYIKDEKIDVLLVSGDIFDISHPSNQTMKLFYRFLADVREQTPCEYIIITAGNHDAPGTLNAPADFTRSFNIYLIGKATGVPEDEIIEIDVKGEKLIVAAVPYLRERDIRRAIAGESIDDMQNRYRTAITKHYQDLAENIQNNYQNDYFSIAMGHLFAIGGEVSDSEKRIYVGGLGDIAASDFPADFDYIALGHLHRPQKVGGKEHIRYSGSPYPLSFSEVRAKKKIIQLTTANKRLDNIKEIEVPVFRKLYRITGNIDECYQKIDEIAYHNDEAEPWIEVNINEKNPANDAYTLINEYVKNKPVKVLSVRNTHAIKNIDITRLVAEDQELYELKPDEVFKKKAEEMGFDLKENQEILDAFYEILNEIEDN